jgi:hypothetical protein
MAKFRLSKWYLDYVTESGDVTVAYTGNVRWGAVRLQYSSLLKSTGQRVSERHSLRLHPEPVLEGSLITWRSKPLKFDCRWQPLFSAVQESVYESDEGSVLWNCMMPLGRAESTERQGTGYVEHLTMTIAPWKLPIESLRWGRFTSASDYVTWIDWQGKFSKRIVYINGKLTGASTISDERVEGEDGIVLMMDRSLQLRDGSLGAKALGGIPGLGKMFPARLLQIEECKWRSRARLERQGRPAVEGWAIHERVVWQ